MDNINNKYTKSEFSFSDITEQHGAITVFMTLCILPILLMTSFFLDASRITLATAHINAMQQLILNDVLAHNDKWLEQNYGLFGVTQSLGAKRFIESDDINEQYRDRLNRNVTQDVKNSVYCTKNEPHSGVWDDDDSDTTCVEDNSKSYVSFLHITPSISDNDSKLTSVENANLSYMIVMEQQVVDNSKITGAIFLFKTVYKLIKGNGGIESKKDKMDEVQDLQKAVTFLADYVEKYTLYVTKLAQTMTKIQKLDCRIGNAPTTSDANLEPFKVAGYEFNLGVNAGCYDDQNLQAVLQSLSSELYSVNTTSNVNLNITNGKTTNTIPAINTLNKSNIINIADVPSNSTMNEITKGAINFYQASDYFHFCTQSNNACESGFADPNSVNSWSDGSTTLGWANRGTAVHKFNKLIGYFKEMSIDIDEIIAEIGAADARDTILYDINDLKTIKTPLDAKYTEAKTFFDGKGYKSCTADSCDKAPEKIYGGMKVMDDMLNKLTIDDQVYKIGDTYTTFADDLKNVYVTYLKQTKAALNDNVYWGKKVTDHPVSYNTEDGKYPFTYKDNIAYTNPYTEDSYKSLIFNATGTEVNLKCHPYQFAKNDAGCESTVFFRKDNDSVGQYKFANYFINKDENPNLTFAAFKSNADTINTFNSDSTNAVNKFSGFDGTVTTNKSLAELEQNIAAVHNRFLAIILNKGVIHLFKNAGDVLLSEIDLNKLLPKDTITTINKTLAFGYAFQMIGKLGESLGTDLDGKPHYLAQNGRAMEMKNYDPEHKVVLPSQLSTAQDPEPTIPGTDALQGDLGLEVLSTILGLAGFIADLFGGDFFGSNNINNLLITSYIASNFADMSYNGDKNNASYKEKINQGGGLTPAQNTTCDKLLSHADVSCSTDEEYIIYGSEGQYSPKTPFVMIFCMRIALDMIGTYQNSEINAMMKPIESAFPPFGYIVATLLRFGIAILEASADMSTLINDGNPVAMFKGSDSKDWSVLGGNAEYLTKGMKCSSACATYQNFLELFTLLKLSNQGSTKANMMKRMADVIQANYYYSKVKTKSVVDRWWADKYRILYADTDLQIRGKYEIKPFFMNFGFLGQLTGDPNRTSLMNFRVSNVAGY